MMWTFYLVDLRLQSTRMKQGEHLRKCGGDLGNESIGVGAREIVQPRNNRKRCGCRGIAQRQNKGGIDVKRKVALLLVRRS